MRYSLRILILLLTLIAGWLGYREAVRLYHWHRHMPVHYRIATVTSDYPTEVRVVFQHDQVKRVEAEAADARLQLAYDIFSDHLAADSFWVASHGELEKAIDPSLRSGVGQKCTRSHLPPFDIQYSYAYPDSVRELVLEKTRSRFLQSGDLSDDLGQRLMAYWISYQDPRAADWIVAQLRSEDSARRIQLLTFLAEPTIVLPSHCTRWLADRDDFEAAVVECLKREHGESLVASRLCQKFKFATAIDFYRQQVELAELYGKGSASPEQVVARVEQRLEPLQSWVTIQADDRAFELLKPCMKVVSQLHLDHQLGTHRLERSRWTPLHFDIEGLGWKVKDVLRRFCERGSQPVQSEALQLAYQYNAMNLFAEFAGQSQQDQLEVLFKERRSLAYEQYFVDFYDSVHGDFSEPQNTAMKSSLPNAESGLEERFGLGNYVQALKRTDPEFAKDKIIQLMHERWEPAFEYSGDLFRGSRRTEVKDILMAELRSDVDRDELVSSRESNLKPVDTSVPGFSCFGGYPRGSRVFTSYDHVGEISKSICLESLLKISPSAAQLFESDPELQQVFHRQQIASEQGGLRKLVQLMRSHHLEPELRSPVRQESGRKDCLPLLIPAFRNANRYSYVTQGWLHDSAAMTLEAIAMACPTFDLCGVVEPLESKMPQYAIEMSADDRVYQFKTRGANRMVLDPLPLVDIVNDCLRRHRIDERMIVIPNGVGYHIFCGPVALMDALEAGNYVYAPTNAAQDQ